MAAFLVCQTAQLAQHGIPVERVLTDNAGSFRSLAFAITALGSRSGSPGRVCRSPMVTPTA
jgi:hypothetical protein